VKALMKLAMDAPTFRRLYSDLGNSSALWKKIPRRRPGLSLAEISYIASRLLRGLRHDAGRGRRHQRRESARVCRDSVTTDHISPAGSIKPTPLPHLPAGARRRGRRLQQLWRTARQPRGDDARTSATCASRT